MPPKTAPRAAATSSKVSTRKAKKDPEVVSKENDVPKKKAKVADKAEKKAVVKKVKAAKPVTEEVEAKEEPKKGKRAAAAEKVSKKQIEKEVVEVPKRVRKSTGAENSSKTEKVVAEDDEKEKPKRKPKAAAVKKSKKKEEADDVEDDAQDGAPTAKVPAKRAPKRKAPKEDGEKTEKKAPKDKAPTVANNTTTKWDKIDFTCSTKNASGEAANFHITSWNVDGLRAWLKKGGLNILEHDKPNILCLQETKCSEDKLPDEIKDAEGYEKYWCSSDQEGYAGVGLLTKVKPLNVIYGVDSEDHDSEGRCITAEYDDFYLVNVYVPNAGRKLVTLPKRLEWNTLFKKFVKNLDKKKPVIVCGDMNVAHTEIDLANPKSNTKNAGFTVEEREGMTDFLGDGYLDTFRHLYPDREKAYTFWTYMAGARAKNVGWRLDYFIVSKRWLDKICDNVILGEVFGSDHCPLALHLTV